METTVVEQGKIYSDGTIRLQIGLAFFAFILIGCNDGAFGVLIPSLRAHYNIDKSTIGLMFMTGTLGYLSAAMASGILVEKLGHRLFLILGGLSYLAGAITIAFTPPFGVVVGANFLIGFGVAIIDAGLNAYIAGLSRNTVVLNNLHAFYGIGALIGPIAATGVLAANWGWNNTYLLWVGMALVMITGYGLLFNGKNRVANSAHHAEGNVLWSAFRLRVAWLGALFLLFYVGAEVSLGNWSYSFLTEERHEATVLSGWLVSGYWTGLTLGRLTLAKIAEKFGWSDKRLIEICLVGTGIGVLLVWLVPFGAVEAFGLVLVGFSLGPLFPTTIALMSSLVPARLLPSTVGFVASLGSMGATLFPWLAGNLAQTLGLWTLLPYVILLSVIMLGIWLALQAQSKIHQERNQ